MIGCTALCFRSLIDAVEAWAMDPVKWMFDGNPEVEKEMNTLLEWRPRSQIYQNFMFTIQCVQKFDGWKDDPVRAQIVSLRKSLEDPLFGFVFLFTVLVLSCWVL